MGVLFMDSFDHYTTLPGKWTTNSVGAIGAYGRFGTNGLYIDRSTRFVSKVLPANKATLYAGVAMQQSGLTYGRDGIFCFNDLETVQVRVVLQTDGKIAVVRGDGTTLATSTNSVLTPAQFHFYEAMITFSNTVGEAIVRVDGVEFINTDANLDTSQSGNAYSNRIMLRFSMDDWWGNTYYDDFWIADDQFYGDCRVQCIMPTGAGNYSQWAPSAGNNWECVDEKPPVTTDYVGEGTVGEIDTYVVENLTPASGTVYAVAGNFYCQKTDSGSRQIALATRLSSTDDAGSGIAVPSSWGFVQDIKATKPGGGAWAIADVNNAEMGQKMIA